MQSNWVDFDNWIMWLSSAVLLDGRRRRRFSRKATQWMDGWKGWTQQTFVGKTSTNVNAFFVFHICLSLEVVEWRKLKPGKINSFFCETLTTELAEDENASNSAVFNLFRWNFDIFGFRVKSSAVRWSLFHHSRMGFPSSKQVDKRSSYDNTTSLEESF